MSQLAVARLWLNLLLGRTEPADDAQRRYARVLQSGVVSIGARGLSTLIALVAVPLTVHYLGPERYGAWMTISTTLAWLGMADLGIGNSLKNAVADAMAKERAKLVSQHIATGFWLLCLVTFVSGAVLAGVWRFVDWGSFFKVSSPTVSAEIARAVGLAIALYVLSFPFSLLDKIYIAHQEGVISNLWTIAGSVLSLGALLVAISTQGGIVALVAAYSGTSLLVSAVNAAWLFGKHRPQLAPRWAHVDRTSAKLLTGSGSLFFVIQVGALIWFNTDNIIIARTLGAEAVSPYAVSWRMFSIPTLLVTLYFPYLWPAYSEAFARRDRAWVARTLRITVFGGTAVTVLLSLPLMLFGRAIISRWVGPEVVPPFALLAWMFCWNVISAPSQAVACMLNGSGHLKGQAVYGFGSALVNVALSVWLATRMGVAGVMAGSVIAWTLFGAVPATWESLLVVRRLGQPASEGEPS